MDNVKKFNVRIIEQPGKVGSLKASALAHLITDYIKTHPEIIENQKEETNAAK